MAFKAQVSLTDNSIKEKRSVLFIENLLVDKANTDISTEDKKANIDGYIDLLSSDKKIVGKITVQVKTVPPKYQGKNSFPCPTSLFAYAENTTDVVYLLAVDHSQNKVLFKYISHTLLEANRGKENQDSITLHFSNNEELRSDNISEVLISWLNTCNSLKFCLIKSDDILQENNALKRKLSDFQENKTTLSSECIKTLQQFSDTYNEFLNTSYLYIKESVFPNIWKRGIAIYEYTDSSLEYSLFNIKNGELLSPIVQLPPRSIFELNHKHDYASFSKAQNSIKENPIKEAIILIKNHIKEFINQKRVIPFDLTFLSEYAIDFISDNYSRLHLSYNTNYNVSDLIGYFNKKYPGIESDPVGLVCGSTTIKLNTVYQVLKYLNDLGISTLDRPYPNRGRYGDSGHVIDSYTPETAFSKVSIVIYSTYRVYQSFIQTNFQLLMNDLDLFYGGNLITVLFEYSYEHRMAIINTYYFKATDNSKEKIITIERVENSTILSENRITDIKKQSELFTREEIIFRGKHYRAFRSEGLNDMTVLFGKYNCLSLFYETLQKRFKTYFEKIGF